MKQLIGLDIGYGFVKVTNGTVGYSFPSVIGDGFIDSLYRINSNNMPLVYDLKVGINNKVYFVGRSAIKHSKFVYRDLATSRSSINDFNILFFSALSLFCEDAINEFNVVPGLPVERMHLLEQLKKEVMGQTSFIIYRNNMPKEIKININALEIVPQPLGTFWSQMLNSRGQVVKSLEGRTGIIDIGFGTTDIVALDDGEFIPSRSRTIATGISTTYNEIRSNIMAMHGIEKETYALDEAVIKRHIKKDGNIVDISNIVNDAFEKLAINIAVEINSTWSVPEYDNLYLTGGGGQAISAHITKHIPRAKCIPDALSANSMGYLLWANRLWSIGSEVGIKDAYGNSVESAL